MLYTHTLFACMYACVNLFENTHIHIERFMLKCISHVVNAETIHIVWLCHCCCCSLVLMCLAVATIAVAAAADVVADTYPAKKKQRPPSLQRRAFNIYIYIYIHTHFVNNVYKNICEYIVIYVLYIYIYVYIYIYI